LDTGFNSRKVAEKIYSMLEERGITKEKSEKRTNYEVYYE